MVGELVVAAVLVLGLVVAVVVAVVVVTVVAEDVVAVVVDEVVGTVVTVDVVGGTVVGMGVVVGTVVPVVGTAVVTVEVEDAGCADPSQPTRESKSSAVNTNAVAFFMSSSSFLWFLYTHYARNCENRQGTAQGSP